MTNKEIRRHLEIRYSEVIEEKNLGAWRIKDLKDNPTEMDLEHLTWQIQQLFPTAIILDASLEANLAGLMKVMMVLFRILPPKKRK